MATQHAALMLGGIRLDIDTPKIKPWAAVVFGHGTGAHGSPIGNVNYAGFLKALASLQIGVVAFTLPGHGLSKGRRGDFRLQDYVTCAGHARAQVRAQWGNIPVIYVGWSQGGLGGTLVAAWLNDAFDGYFLHNAAIGTEPEIREFSSYAGPSLIKRALYKALMLILVDGLARIPLLELLPWHTPLYLPLNKIFEGDEEAKKRWLCDPWVVRWYTWGAIRSLARTRVENLDKVTVPVLVFQPEKDISPPDYMRRMMLRFGNGRLAIRPDRGHSMIRKHPEELARVVRNFLAVVVAQRKRTTRQR